MTNYSLNGWVAPPPALATGTVPGTSKKVTMRKEVLPVFLAYLHDWHHTVHSIEYTGALGPDGYAYRDSRTGAGLSNHSSGTAVDVTYDWLKADHQRHMTTTQIAAVHKLLDKYKTTYGKRIFGWGGDWAVGTYCDEMHTELIQSWSPGSLGHNCTLADVQNVIKRLGIQPDGTIVPPLHAIQIGGRTALEKVEVIRQSSMTAERFDNFNPKCPNLVPAGYTVIVPSSVTAIYAGRDHTG